MISMFHIALTFVQGESNHTYMPNQCHAG